MTGIDAAEAFCVENGGHLATIHNEIEEFLLAEAAREVTASWIFAGGARRTTDKGQSSYAAYTWFWNDGSPWDYTPAWDVENTPESGLCSELYAYPHDHASYPG